MFGTMQKGVNAYAQVGVETGVAAASPHRLIAMLYEGAIIALTTAIGQTKVGEIEAKGKSLTKVTSIIDNGLRASLNKEAGGDIAASLDALYQYMSVSLMQASLHNDTAKMEEILGLLRDLKEAWDVIADDKPATAQPAQAQVRAAPYDALAPRSQSLFKA